MLAFGAFLVLRSAEHEQEIIGNTVRESARDAAFTIDHEFGALRARLLMLAGSHYLRMGDLAAFRKQAAEGLGQDGLAVILSDPTGQQVVNTRASLADTLPTAPDIDAVRRVVATGQAEVSDLVRVASTGELFVAIDVPVPMDGRTAYVLGLDIAPMVPRLMAELRLPPDWIVTISDRIGRTVARSREAGRFVGQVGREAVLERFRGADEGWFPLDSREGVPAYNAFAHVPFSGWVVAIGIPDAVLYAPVRHSTRVLIMAGGAALALAVLLGLAIGRTIAGAITRLAGYAEAVGRGERIALPPTGIQETDAVAASLQAAGERLRQSAEERAVLLDRTITAREAERKRIARELHDSLGQYLTALRLGFTAIEPQCAIDESARQRLSELKALAADLGRELNRIAWELRPMALDDLGLRRAITQYLEEWADRSHLEIDLAIDLGDRRLPQAVETALFRVLQEAIGNVVKHAGASRVGVIVAATDHEVRLIVEDDGRGFALGAGADGLELGVQHLGLLGVRERLAIVGGGLDIESDAVRGTTVYVRIAL